MMYFSLISPLLSLEHNFNTSCVNHPPYFRHPFKENVNKITHFGALGLGLHSSPHITINTDNKTDVMIEAHKATNQCTAIILICSPEWRQLFLYSLFYTVVLNTSAWKEEAERVGIVLKDGLWAQLWLINQPARPFHNLMERLSVL